jgi:hypothetical protein
MINDLTPVLSQKQGAIFLSGSFQQVTPTGTERNDPCITGRFTNFPPVRLSDEPGRTNYSHAKLHDDTSRRGRIVTTGGFYSQPALLREVIQILVRAFWQSLAKEYRYVIILSPLWT